MSIARVMVMEHPVPWNEFVKVFRGSVEPVFKKFKREKILNRWSLTQIGDHKGMLIMEFDNKSKLNKFLKVTSEIRKDVTDDIGMQSWIYSGSVKASG